MRSEYPHYVNAMQINEPVSIVFDNRCKKLLRRSA